jgi:hypothetical protein
VAELERPISAMFSVVPAVASDELLRPALLRITCESASMMT